MPVGNPYSIHAAAVYDTAAETLKLYIDGALDNTENLTTAFIAELGAGRIGGWDGGRWFDGYIDDVRFYSRVLSDPEIAIIYTITQ